MNRWAVRVRWLFTGTPYRGGPVQMSKLLAVTAACCCSIQASNAQENSSQTRPNVIVIVVDDLRFDEFGAGGHPYLDTPNIDRLATEGAMFTDGFHAVPLCSPNRASIMTGQYPSRHGIIDNVARNRLSHRLQTFPQAMQATGYETGFLGKWHMGNDPTPRPGFDYWAAFPGQGRTIDPDIFEAGRLHRVEGYITDLLTDRAVDFINTERNAPFMLYVGHKAVHPDARQFDDGSVDPDYPRRYVPAPRHHGLYTTPRDATVPLMRGDATDWRESALIEFYTHENPRPWLMDMDYRAVRTDRYKLIHWVQHPGEQELYDLREDPYEMHNLIDDPEARDIVNELRAELTRLVVRAMGLTR